MTIPVNFFFRKPFHDYHSIELLFADIIHKLPEDISARFVEMPYVSKGLFRRLMNKVIAELYAGLYRVTGKDVSF